MTNPRFRAAPGVTALLVVLLAATTTRAQLREVWVVNEASKDISIIDSPTDDPATIDTISLGGDADPRPYGIAFSTFADDPGGHAFVTQGSSVKVIAVATHSVVSTVDVAALIGASAATLKGADSARADLFEDAAGTRQIRNYLHIAADVSPTPGDPFEPWFIVLDQAALVGSVTRPARVADGPLSDTPPVAGEAMEVRVLGGRAGDAVQRAWYTYRDTGSPQKIGAALVVSGSSLSSPWSVARSHLTALAAGDAAPESVHPGAPHSQELPLLPEGPAGTLLNLDSGMRCPISGSPRALAVAGPGIASYDIWVASINPGAANDLLTRTNWETCDADTPINVGKNPVDIDTLGRVEWQEVYVANRDSDTVTIVTAASTTPITIALTAGAPAACVKCPRSLAVVESAATVCRAVDLRAEALNSVPDVRYSWDGLGCEQVTSFKVWCRCLSTNLADCPTDCINNCPPSPFEQTGETWCEVDIVISDPSDPGGSQDIRNDGASTQTQVEPNDDES